MVEKVRQVPVLHMICGTIDDSRTDLQDITLFYFMRTSDEGVRSFDTYEECLNEITNYVVVGSLNRKFLSSLNRILVNVSIFILFWYSVSFSRYSNLKIASMYCDCTREWRHNFVAFSCNFFSAARNITSIFELSVVIYLNLSQHSSRNSGRHEWACHSSVLYLILAIILDNSLLRNGWNPSAQPWNWEWFIQSEEKSKDEREKIVRITHELIIRRITNMYLSSQQYIRKTVVTNIKFWPCAIIAAATCQQKTSQYMEKEILFHFNISLYGKIKVHDMKKRKCFSTYITLRKFVDISMS